MFAWGRQADCIIIFGPKGIGVLFFVDFHDIVRVVDTICTSLRNRWCQGLPEYSCMHWVTEQSIVYSQHVRETGGVDALLLISALIFKMLQACDTFYCGWWHLGCVICLTQAKHLPVEFMMHGDHLLRFLKNRCHYYAKCHYDTMTWPKLFPLLHGMCCICSYC